MWRWFRERYECLIHFVDCLEKGEVSMRIQKAAFFSKKICRSFLAKLIEFFFVEELTDFCKKKKNRGFFGRKIDNVCFVKKLKVFL